MQTLFKSNLFSNSSSKVGAKSFLSGGKKLGSSIVGAAKNNIINFSRTAKAMVPQKKEENENSFIKNYTNFFGSKKTEKILRKNLKLVRDSLVNTFEIARHLKAAIVSISKGLKGGVGGKGGGLFDMIKAALAGGLMGALIAALPFLLKLAAIGSIVGLGLLLWKSKKFRDATLEFIGSAAKKIVELLWGAIKALLPKWIWNPVGFIRDIITGGDEFSKKHSELDQRLKDAGMNTKGISENRSKQEIRHSKHGRTEEQQKIFEEVEAEREKLSDAKTDMKGDIKSALSDIDDERNNSPQRKALVDKIEGPNRLKDENKRLKVRKQLEIYDNETARLKREEKENIISDANQKVSSPSSTVEGTKSDLNNMNFENFYDDGSLDESKFNFVPITFNNAQAQDSSVGDVVNSSGGSGSSGNAVTFYSSSNSDPSYHKLNALMTFNIV